MIWTDKNCYRYLLPVAALGVHELLFAMAGRLPDERYFPLRQAAAQAVVGRATDMAYGCRDNPLFDTGNINLSNPVLHPQSWYTRTIQASDYANNTHKRQASLLWRLYSASCCAAQ